MLQYSSLADLWGADQLIHLPLDRLGERIRFDRDLLSPGGALPADVPIVFTTHVTGDIQLFNVVEFQVGDQEPLQLIVIGAAPDNPDLMFTLDTASGVVALLDPISPGVELVNSSLALFVEFLYHTTRFFRTDPGGSARATQARQLRDQLGDLDSSAFDDPESWWSIAFAQLAGID